MTAKAKTPLEDEVEELNIPTLALRGDFIDDVQVLSSTSASLVVSVGHLKDDERGPVMVPFVQLNLGSEEEEDGSEYVRYSGTLTLDNAFFVLSDLSQELKFACEELRLVSAGPLKPEPARLALARKFAQSAKAALDFALLELDRIEA